MNHAWCIIIFSEERSDTVGDHVLFHGLLLGTIIWLWAVRDEAQLDSRLYVEGRNESEHMSRRYWVHA
jgi:hypothetical protein